MVSPSQTPSLHSDLFSGICRSNLHLYSGKPHCPKSESQSLLPRCPPPPPLRNLQVWLETSVSIHLPRFLRPLPLRPVLRNLQIQLQLKRNRNSAQVPFSPLLITGVVCKYQYLPRWTSDLRSVFPSLWMIMIITRGQNKPTFPGPFGPLVLKNVGPSLGLYFF